MTFWREHTKSVSASEAAQHESLEQSGARLLNAVRAWLAETAEHLTPEQRAWLLPESLDAPEWLRPEIPEHAASELQRLLMRTPRATPDHWEPTEEQARAIAVVERLRDMVAAARGVPPAQAVTLLERALRTAHAVDVAHLQPWETVAARGLDYSETQAAKGRKGGRSRWGGPTSDAVGEIVQRLARQRDGWGDPEPPSELWPRLFSALEDAGLRPEDRGDRYECADGFTITEEAFKRRIQRARE